MDLQWRMEGCRTVMRTLRISHILIQPILVWDDGEHLSPGPAQQPQPIAVVDLPDLPAKLQAALDSANAEVESA